MRPCGLPKRGGEINCRGLAHTETPCYEEGRLESSGVVETSRGSAPRTPLPCNSTPRTGGHGEDAAFVEMGTRRRVSPRLWMGRMRRGTGRSTERLYGRRVFQRAHRPLSRLSGLPRALLQAGMWLRGRRGSQRLSPTRLCLRLRRLRPRCLLLDRAIGLSALSGRSELRAVRLRRRAPGHACLLDAMSPARGLCLWRLHRTRAGMYGERAKSVRRSRRVSP